MSIKLSILVPTVPNRIDYFYPKIMKTLLGQIEKYDNIELIAFFDNKKRTIGKKRQEMLNLTQGEYVVFIDDDDTIADDYVDQIMIALTNNPDTDCVVFDCLCTINGREKLYCKYGIEFEYTKSHNQWRGKPAHTMVWKSSIALKHQYRDQQNGEDVDWVKRACIDIKTQTRIDKILYFYNAEYHKTSETVDLPDAVIKNNIKNLIESEAAARNR